MSQSTNIYIHPSAYADEGCAIGDNTKVWHFCHIMPKAVIGKNCSLGQNVFVANNVVIGDNAKIQNNVSLYEGVVCEDDVFLGPSMVLTNVINPRSGVERKSEYKKTLIKKGATIGANATIVCGITLGEYCFIAAGAVVNRDVPAYALIAGVPGKQIGWMSKMGHRLYFDASNVAVCSSSGEKYILEGASVRRC
ncbi:MAG: acyltransferase [Chitinophagales bacterium]|nr:acyltransferase [Chitinophagales bacterium]